MFTDLRTDDYKPTSVPIFSHHLCLWNPKALSSVHKIPYLPYVTPSFSLSWAWLVGFHNFPMKISIGLVIFSALFHPTGDSSFPADVFPFDPLDSRNWFIKRPAHLMFFHIRLVVQLDYVIPSALSSQSDIRTLVHVSATTLFSCTEFHIPKCKSLYVHARTQTVP